MKPTAEESGTFWVSDVVDAPPTISARVETTFHEIGWDELTDLQRAMSPQTPYPIRQRLEGGRRCFGLKVAGHIVSYGWVSRGVERVGELERDFYFQEDEVYVWDCGTIAAYRGIRCYTALLNQIIHQFHREGMRRVWIGASRQNIPSVRGIQLAGFRHVLDLTYKRFGWFKLIRFTNAPTASPAHLAAAYRILLDGEWRLNSIALGFKKM